MAESERNDIKARSGGFHNKNDRRFGDEKRNKQEDYEGLERTCCQLIERGHLNVWGYGWEHFQNTIKFSEEINKNKNEFDAAIHGAELAK